MDSDLRTKPVDQSCLEPRHKQIAPSNRPLVPTPRPPGAPRDKIKRSRAAIIRRFLESKRPQDLDERGFSRFMAMISNMARIAASKSPQSVNAFNAIMAYAYGKPMPSKEEQDAIAKGGIQIVYLSAPMIDGEVEKGQERLPPKPDFIEAEFKEDE